jgi:hypothetical protein
LTRALLKLPSSHVSKLTAVEPASAFRLHGLGSQEPEGHADRETRIGQAWKKLTAAHQFQQELKSKSAQSSDDGQDADGILGELPGEPHSPGIVNDGRNAKSLLEQLKKEAVDPKKTSEEVRLESTSIAKHPLSADRPPGEPKLF